VRQRTGRPSPRRLVALAAVAATLLAAPARAQDADAAARVVVQQLDAFERGDFDAAYGLASASIHEQFDRAAFEAMVRGGYPEIAAPASVAVDGHEAGPNGAVFVFVRVWGANGRAVQAVYELVPEGGAFRVNGVVTRAAGEAASRGARW
jgi:hypothetical protein